MSSQESSPITQWQKEKLNPILGELFSTGEIAHTAGLTHDMRMDALRKATRLITSATIELIEGLIGENKTSYSKPLAMPDEVYFNLVAQDQLRDQLRQSLKEMNQ